MPPRTPETRKTRRNLPTSRRMVDEVLITQNTVKGITLKRLYSYIIDKYQIAINPQRQYHIKKHISELKADGIVVNKTGKGFTGHFKLVNKKQYEHQLQIASGRSRRSQSRVHSHISMTDAAATVSQAGRRVAANRNGNNIAPAPESMQFSQSYSESETLPEQQIEDTPILASSVHASTPFPESPSVLLAPKKKKANVTTIHEATLPQPMDPGTPRTSLPGKRRRLLRQ